MADVTPFPADPTAPCEHCGRFGAYRFATGYLCVECYAQRGSCCAEFGGDDATQPAADKISSGWSD